MQQILIVLGIIFVAVGVMWPYLTKLPFGQLPGDVVYESGNFSFYFPIVTCILVSIVISVIFNFFR